MFTNDSLILIMYTYIKLGFISIRYATLRYHHTTQNIVLSFRDLKKNKKKTVIYHGPKYDKK